MSPWKRLHNIGGLHMPSSLTESLCWKKQVAECWVVDHLHLMKPDGQVSLMHTTSTCHYLLKPANKLTDSIECTTCLDFGSEMSSAPSYHSIILSSYHSIIHPIILSSILSSYHSFILSFYHPFYHSIILSFSSENHIIHFQPAFNTSAQGVFVHTGRNK